MFLFRSVFRFRIQLICVYPDGTYVDFPVHKLRTPVAFVASTTFDNNSYTPNDYPEATRINDPRWLTAVKRCMDDLNSMNVGVWTKLKTVPVKDLISSRFVFQIKFKKERGWYAFCRWTPRGFEQVPDKHFDPDEIFAGTPQLSTLRFILTKALLTGRKTFHFDFKRAFSNTPLERTIYVKMPKGYKHFDADGDECCIALSKSSEGLKQSGANWLKMLHKYLINYGFKQSVTDGA